MNAPWVIIDAEGYLVYDGPPPDGRSMSFGSQAEAEARMRASNWHYAEMVVGRLVGREVFVASGTHNKIDGAGAP
jgi:hypothetical protein